MGLLVPMKELPKYISKTGISGIPVIYNFLGVLQDLSGMDKHGLHFFSIFVISNHF